MPKAKSKAVPKSDAAPDMSPVVGLTTAMMVANPAVTKAWTDIMKESARFVSERLQEDMEAQKVLLQCKTPADLVQFQSEFVLKAMQQYTDEAQRITKIMTDAGEDIAKDARHSWSRVYDNIPL